MIAGGGTSAIYLLWLHVPVTVGLLTSFYEHFLHPLLQCGVIQPLDFTQRYFGHTENRTLLRISSEWHDWTSLVVIFRVQECVKL